LLEPFTVRPLDVKARHTETAARWQLYVNSTKRMYLQNLGLVLFSVDGDIDVLHGGFLLDEQCKQDANEGEDN
jgi:hypothetical protein